MYNYISYFDPTKAEIHSIKFSCCTKKPTMVELEISCMGASDAGSLYYWSLTNFNNPDSHCVYRSRQLGLEISADPLV